ncbi:MAG: hypothetical protein J6C28_03375 [Bacilli bacterium]|nr:hypothetical protein [Bacilli bacterium]
MTWGEWIESDYNTAGIKVYTTQGYLLYKNSLHSQAGGEYLYPEDIIIANHTYYESDGK